MTGISFTIDKGEFVAIVGQSGSGKSTCMNIIGALDLPSEGEYLLTGLNITRYDEDQLAQIRNRTLGFIFQQYNLIPKLNVYENVELPLIYANVPEKERYEKVIHALERVGLANRMRHYQHELSGGSAAAGIPCRALVNDQV